MAEETTSTNSLKSNETIIDLVRNLGGRPYKIKDADDLWAKFVAYCDWVDHNPWQIKSVGNNVSNHGNGQTNGLNQSVSMRQRAYTLHGFCAYCGICSKWADWKKSNLNRRGFKDVVGTIENVVISQQIDGAMIGQFNEGLVARLNGFADRQEITGADGTDLFKLPKLSEEDIRELAKANGVEC